MINTMLLTTSATKLLLIVKIGSYYLIHNFAEYRAETHAVNSHFYITCTKTGIQLDLSFYNRASIAAVASNVAIIIEL